MLVGFVIFIFGFLVGEEVVLVGGEGRVYFGVIIFIVVVVVVELDDVIDSVDVGVF